jgi:hypothetical protein
MNRLSIDIGCGYRGDIHYPNLDCDILLEPFLNNSNNEWVNILRENGHPIMASAEDLCFRENVFSYVQIRAVMEHIPKPLKCLYDMKYITKRNGLIKIIIPIITSHFKHYLKLLFIAFPYGIYEVFLCMKKMMSHYHDEGLAHVSDIKPNDLTQYFKKHEVIPHYYRSKVFYGWSGKIFHIITRGKEPIHDIQGYYEIKLWKD